MEDERRDFCLPLLHGTSLTLCRNQTQAPGSVSCARQGLQELAVSMIRSENLAGARYRHCLTSIDSQSVNVILEWVHSAAAPDYTCC
jgi:hypothetical protein